MQPEAKKLGILLIESGLLTPVQLQEALRHQRISGGRLGSNLVAQGIINEDTLMDFLARQTGVPRMDLKNLEISPAVLQKIPRRLAEHLTILPVAFKEPKSLVLAMADPMDLSAVDSARFASSLNIEPVVAPHTALRNAISEHYGRLANGAPAPAAIEVVHGVPRVEGLPVHIDLTYPPLERADTHPVIPGPHGYPVDPFFSGTPAEPGPFSFFADPKGGGSGLNIPEDAKGHPEQPPVIHQRSAMSEHVPPLENYGTRALVLGVIRMLQRRGILNQDELQRLLSNLTDAREIDPDV